MKRCIFNISMRVKWAGKVEKVKKNTPSLTAELAAMMRSVAYRSSTLRKIVDDRYARLFCGIQSKPAFFLNFFLSLFDRSLTHIKIPMLQVGLLCAVIRHRYIENTLMGLLKKGKWQVVLIGAGYDTKSLRLKNDNVRIFELDHPSTQKRKVSILNRKKLMPSGTSFLPCDLTIDNPGECLERSSLNKNIPVIVIAEGVFSYFRMTRISELLDDINALADVVHLIFDYRHPVEGKLNAAKNWHENFKNKGEQYLGLLTKVEMNQLLEENGFITNSASDLCDIAAELLPTFSAKELNGSSEIRLVSKKASIETRHE
jgi:methyltransferase (TIGR00027 family)